MEQFNYANKNNFLQWLGLIFTGLASLFFTFLFIKIRDNGEFMYALLVPIIGLAIICLIFINKLFLSKLYIAENYIEYKSPFTKVRLDRDRIKGIDLLKKPRKRAPKYLNWHDKPDINIGTYFIIIRKTNYKPDSAYFLTFNPVEDTYITAEYRETLFKALKKYNYL